MTQHKSKRLIEGFVATLCSSKPLRGSSVINCDALADANALSALLFAIGTFFNHSSSFVSDCFPTTFQS
jgi:hypothetical protein